MSDPRDDFILDLFLEEALSGVQPPDVSQRVLSALAARAGGVPAAGASAPPSLRPIPIGGFRVQGSGFSEERRRLSLRERAFFRGAKGDKALALVSLALAASLLLALGGYWFFAQGGAPLVAQRNSHAERDLPPTAAKDRDVANDAALAKAEPERSIAAPDVANDLNPPAGEATEPNQAATQLVDDRRAAESGASAAEPLDADDVNGPDGELAGASPSAGLSASASSDADIVAYINGTIRVRAKDAGLRLSPPATEAEWCRRVHLDLIGRIPTIDDLEAFLVDNSRDKRSRLIDRLLGFDDSRPRKRSSNAPDLPADRYVESYARFWTTLWTNLLIGRNGGMEPNSPINREALQQYLRRSFAANKPYNQLAFELVGAHGSNLPGEDDYNGAVNFLLAHLQEKATPATAKTAQIFLGLQVQCTQCHNHPFNDWKQNRFWELNAFFRQTRETREMRGPDVRLVRLVDEDFAGESGDDPAEAEVYYEQRNGILQVAYPTFVDGTTIDRDGRVAQVDRRRELARLIARSEQLSLAIVNRLWAHFLGHGFTKPVDDLGPHNPPSHPELLARLAREFAASGHDLKRLMRWITLSEPYGLSSRFGPKQGNAADDPTVGTPPLFTHFYVRQMLAEQLYDSLLVATGAHLTEGNYTEQQRIKDEWLRQFFIAFGTDENDEATTFDGTITQTLVMMNGELTRRATSGESGSFLYRIAQTDGKSGSEPKNLLNQLYRAALARYPSKSELQLVGGLLGARDDESTVLEDVWWALLNSNEFILNH
ncbi:MAG TPA: DUF1549 domain-containing protein [Pirellulales bacterium]|nr:DUF1549 domain-containing protein [Pirellulales bacterium]